MFNSIKNNQSDFIGILSSSLCLVHCIATPLLITFGIGFITNPFYKYLFLFISFCSIFKATEKTAHSKFAVFLWASFGGFFVSNLLEEEYHWLHYSGYTFAVLIIIGHILNIQHCNKCSKSNNQ